MKLEDWNKSKSKVVGEVFKVPMSRIFTEKRNGGRNIIISIESAKADAERLEDEFHAVQSEILTLNDRISKGEQFVLTHIGNHAAQEKLTNLRLEREDLLTSKMIPAYFARLLSGVTDGMDVEFPDGSYIEVFIPGGYNLSVSLTRGDDDDW